ncbi:MAG: mandelate racemase/muconate lactonizing enzyme family protein [Alphaproteobacteria bacterium]
MKITDLEVIELRVPAPDVEFDGSYIGCVLRLHTDAGLVGIAETDGMPPVVRAVIEAPRIHSAATGLRTLLVGRDPADIEALWNLAYERTFYYGRRGAVIHALSLVDIALWDLKGKAESRSVADLLGPRKRDRVKAYGTIYPTGATPDEVRRNIDRGLARGLRAIKVCGDPAWRDDPDLAALVLRTARAHVGDGIDLMLDAATAWATVEQVLPVMPVLAECRYGWLEGPLPPDELAGHARLHGMGVPIADGEALTTRFELAHMIEQARLDVVQPDASLVGGLTELVRLRPIAARHGCRMVLHGYKSNLLLATNLAFYASDETGGPLEYSMSESPLRWGLVKEPFPIDGDGMVAIPIDRPGLGVTLDDDVIARYRVT